MRQKLISISLLFSFLFGSGGYDSGTSAGKGNWDISLTWNPLNYFKQGQSYMVLGYGLTKHIDINGYFSVSQNSSNNYYLGLSYQFIDSQFLDLSTAIGLRAYTDNNTVNLFIPQLLYTVNLSERFRVGGSFVNIKSESKSLGLAKDLFLMCKLYENKKYKVDITSGAFNPVSWEPKSGDWHLTYSLDIKVKI